MTGVQNELAEFLAECPPFDSLARPELETVAQAAVVHQFAEGDLILDAFTTLTNEVFVVVSGAVDLWNNADRITDAADERIGRGSVFGFSAMLTERSVGPRALAASDATVAEIPASVVSPAFTSRRGARFLAESVSTAGRRSPGSPTYSLIDELIVRDPLIVPATTAVAEVARMMTEQGFPYAVVGAAPGQFGLVTDSLIRERIVFKGLPTTTPVEQVMETSPAIARLGDSAAEASIQMFDHEAEFVLVTDRAGALRGVVAPRDFAVSSTTAGVSLHEQLRRAATTEELMVRSRRVPGMLADLLSRGLASGKVIAVYSAILDTIVRRAIGLIFAEHPELSVDAFTWLSLGSNGRREAVLSSDVDSAVAFVNDVPPDEIRAYRAAFAEVCDVLARAGLSSDGHGASAQTVAFARTNDNWRASAEQWLADPVNNQGAMMTSLLVDGRPIHGDPGLPAVSRVFSDLRQHPGTMRLLLQESLASRAKLRSIWGIFNRRSEAFNVKKHALLPVVNIARWAALSVGSAALPTTERLRSAAGSAMLPQDQADIMIEVFEVLQRLRLRYQLLQHQRGDKPSDVLMMDQMSPIDRSIVAQAVREISSVQRRMDNVSVYVPAESWASPDQT